MIARRLSTIQHADKVIVLKAGKIVEQGTHDALMSARGAYWEMVSLQNLDLVEDEDLDQVSVSDMSVGSQ